MQSPMKVWDIIIHLLPEILLHDALEMETSITALYEGNTPVAGDSPNKDLEMQSFGVLIFYL